MAEVARIAEMDMLRGAAILAVIAIHVSINFNVIEVLNGLVLTMTAVDVFSHYAVPLFIFISGFVLPLKYFEGFSPGRFYVKRAFAVIPPYLAFSALYLAGKYVLSGPMSAYQVLFSILTASSSYHLWFFAVIVELYLLYPLLIGAYRRFEAAGKATMLLISTLAIQVGWNIACSLLITFGGLPGVLLERVFLSQIFFFILGIFASRNFDRIKASIGRVRPSGLAAVAVLLTAAISASWLYDFIYDNPYRVYSLQTLVLNVVPRLIEPVLYVTAFVLCFKAAVLLTGNKGIITDAMSSLGKYSFGIYLIHIFFLTLLAKALGAVHIEPTGWVFYPLLFAGTLALSYAAIYLLSYLPHSMALVGVHNDIKGGMPNKA